VIDYQSINSEGVESITAIHHHGTMSQSLAEILVHTVFSTKDGRPFLRDKSSSTVSTRPSNKSRATIHGRVAEEQTTTTQQGKLTL